MNKFAVLLLNFILISPVLAGDVTQQQDALIFSDQDLEKYKKSSKSASLPQNSDLYTTEELKKVLDKQSIHQQSLGNETKDEIKAEISESEKKSVERELSTIVASMISQLKVGNIEGALTLFVESRKDKHRRIFKTLKDNNTLKVAFEGYMGVEIDWISDHLAECGFTRKENGSIYSYPIRFMEVAKGVWKIYDF